MFGAEPTHAHKHAQEKLHDIYAHIHYISYTNIHSKCRHDICTHTHFISYTNRHSKCCTTYHTDTNDKKMREMWNGRKR